MLGLGTCRVFAVTGVMFVPQGEFDTDGALTLAFMQTGKVPGTIWLLLLLAACAAVGVARALVAGVAVAWGAMAAPPVPGSSRRWSGR